MARAVRSSAMANRLIAMPASMAGPNRNDLSAANKSLPSPPAPMTAAKTATANERFTTWFSPTSRSVRGMGRRTSNSVSSRLHPLTRASSNTLAGGFLIARGVARAMAGIEKITMTTEPASGPNPKNTTIGGR